MSSDSIPQKMRAATIKDFKKGYEVKDIDVPTDLGPNDILLKIAAAGYCHTDLQVMEGVYESQGAKPGLVGSHEPVGTVVKAGSDAGKSGIKVAIVSAPSTPTASAASATLASRASSSATSSRYAWLDPQRWFLRVHEG